MADSDFTTYMQEFYRQQEQRRQARRNTLKDEILPALAKAGVDRVVAEYSGYGDSGAIDGVDYLSADGQPVEGAAALVSDRLEDALYEFLPAGFEINEGGQGTLTLCVKDAKVVLEHGQNVTEVNESTEEFEL